MTTKRAFLRLRKSEFLRLPANSITPLVDTHCHLDYIQRETGEAARDVLERAMGEGIEWLVNPGVTPEKFPDVMALAEGFENVYAALAVHPTDVADIEHTPQWLADLEAMLAHPKVIAIGETGLDYYWGTEHKDLQQTCFRQLLGLGVKHHLPVIIHDREAHDDIEVIVSEFPGVRGILHCFSGDGAFALRMIDKGFYISFAGNLTFKKATNLHEAAQVVPLEWILIETDSPFLSPVPFRGKPNEPSRVRYVAEKIAELKGISYEEVAAVTTQNAKKAFGRC